MKEHLKDESEESGLPRRLRMAFTYGAMVIGAIALFLVIDARGGRLVAPAPAGPPAAGPAVADGKPDVLAHLLIALAAVLVTGRLLSVPFRAMGQPPVMAEVLGGILL